jgi:TPP-dependent indolepyruvate ferredoxin oxidoreductase alpha subunit
MDDTEKLEYKVEKVRAGMKQVVEQDGDQLETHFVENPFIKSRERVGLSGKAGLSEEQLKSATDADMREAAQRDIFISKETGKMVVKDLEKEQEEKDAQKTKRKAAGFAADSDTDSEDEAAARATLIKKGSSARDLKKIIKD